MSDRCSRSNTSRRGSRGCSGARPAAKRVGADGRLCLEQLCLPGSGRSAELRADGRVKIGQSCAELLLQGRGVKCLFSHFALCLGEELHGACAPLAFPTGTRQAQASSGF